jgi:hypothetical protein
MPLVPFSLRENVNNSGFLEPHSLFPLPRHALQVCRMKTEIKLRMEMFGRLLTLNITYGLGARASYLAACFAELATIEDQMRAAAGRQCASHRAFREHAARRAAASAALQQWMSDLALVARSLPVERYGGIAERFRMPRSQSYLAQTISADAFIRALRELPEVFAPRGFDEPCIAEAESLIAQVEAANRAKISRFSRRIQQTANLLLLSQRGLAIAREIDACLQRSLRADASLLAQWNFARHIPRRGKKSPPALAQPALENVSASAEAPADTPQPAPEESLAPNPGNPPATISAPSVALPTSGAPIR